MRILRENRRNKRRDFPVTDWLLDAVYSAVRAWSRRQVRERRQRVSRTLALEHADWHRREADRLTREAYEA